MLVYEQVAGLAQRFDLLLRAWLGDTGWFLIGVGAGIACAVLGSLAHDALTAGTGDRRLP